MAYLGSCFTTFYVLSNKQQLRGPRPNTSSSQPRFTNWLPLGISKPSKNSSHIDCFIAHARWLWAEHRWGLTLSCTTRENQSLHTKWTALDLVGVPPPFPCTADPPQRAEVGGKWSQQILAADWPGKIPPIDLPTAIKAQLQKEGVLSPYGERTLSTQLA